MDGNPSGIILETFNLSFAVFVFISKDSVRNILGGPFCDWVPLLGNNTGTVIWGALLANHRILYIKAHH
jgi:hypothetical protein